jgi:subtilisin family serine protease
MFVHFTRNHFRFIAILTLIPLVGALPLPVSADEEPVILVVQITPGADCAQLASDYQADLLGVVVPLSLCRLRMSDQRSRDSLTNDPHIIFVQEDYLLEAQPRWMGAGGDGTLEAQPRWMGAGGEPGADYDEQWAVGKIRAPQAQSLTQGQGTTVAVLDTGVDLNHPLLEGKLVPGYDFVDGDAIPDEVADGIDDDSDGRVDEAVGHGTHIAGVIALVAPDAKIMPVRIFNSDGLGTYFDGIQGIVYAVDHGAQVINLSGSGGDDADILRAAVDYAWDHGVLVVAAGGVNTLGYPALYEHAISVGASDQEDYAAEFAVFQEGLPTVYAPGISIFSAYTDGNDYPDKYACAWWSGNSMATPFVAGEAALLLSSGNCNHDCAAALIPDTKFPEMQSGVPKRIDLYDAIATAKGQLDLDLKGQHQSGASTSTTLHPYLKIANEGNTLPLSELTLRYWYTGGPELQVYSCDQAAVGCQHVTGHIVHLNKPRVDADQYLEIGFTGDAGYLLGGRDSGQIENQIARTDHNLYTELNDYSFNPTETYADWDHVTVYHQGNLVWGQEPRLPILVVDDDQCNPYGAYYEGALNALGKSYDYWNICLYGAPTAADLNQYDIVIWFTGNDYQNTLTYTDRSNLADYLDNGGRLLISGQDIDYDIGGGYFFRNYLHAVPAWYSTGLYWLMGYDIMQGTNVSILGGDGANNQVSPAGVNLGPGAVGLFNYGGGYGWGGLRWEGDYRVVYLSFGFEAINSANSRTNVMDKSLTWMEDGRRRVSSGAVFFDDFETSKGWVLNPNGTDTATLGWWERGNPEQTAYGGVTYQMESTVSGDRALATGLLAGSSVGSNDLDGGVTTVRSPLITLPGEGDITLSFRYYLSHYNNATSDDYLQIKVVGETTEIILEEQGSPDFDQALWADFSVSLDQFAGQTIYLQIEAADGGGGSLLEAAIDDVLITQQ